MTPRTACTRMVAALALVFCLAGCSDFSRHHFGGVRRSADAEEGPPRPSETLAIRNPPLAPPWEGGDGGANPPRDENVKPATFLPDRNPPIQLQFDGNPQAMQHPLRVLYQRADQRHAQMDSYIFRLKRREVVAGRQQPEETMHVKLRREPFSVHLKWLSEEGRGREVIYVRGKYKNQMQVLMAPGDPLALFGKRQSISPDDAMVRAKSRYPITETGLGSLIETFGRMVAGIEKGDPREGTAKYLDRVKRPEFAAPVEAVHQAVPAGVEANLPKGGNRWWFFDATTGLPVLRITHDSTGEVEYYCYDHIQWPVRLDDDDFNPDRLWRR